MIKKWKKSHNGTCQECGGIHPLNKNSKCFMCFVPTGTVGNKSAKLPTTAKALYIFEFNNGDYVQCEWMIAHDDLSYSEQVKEAYEHLMRINEYESIKEAEMYCTVESIYRVENGMIDAVFNSRK